MIGHLQRNKVKYMAGFVSLIHGVDSPRLLKEINKQAKTWSCDSLFVTNSYSGRRHQIWFDEQELNGLIDSDAFKAMENIKIVGLMGMATFTDNKTKYEENLPSLNPCSMD